MYKHVLLFARLLMQPAPRAFIFIIFILHLVLYVIDTMFRFAIYVHLYIYHDDIYYPFTALDAIALDPLLAIQEGLLVVRVDLYIYIYLNQ